MIATMMKLLQVVLVYLLIKGTLTCYCKKLPSSSIFQIAQTQTYLNKTSIKKNEIIQMLCSFYHVRRQTCSQERSAFISKTRAFFSQTTCIVYARIVEMQKKRDRKKAWNRHSAKHEREEKLSFIDP